jgi:hypothetical protein
MNTIIVSIPTSGNEEKQFKGITLIVDSHFSFFHGNYNQLTAQAIAESGILSGSIPVILRDVDGNNLAAMTLTAEEGKWKGTSLNAWTVGDTWFSSEQFWPRRSIQGEKEG